MPIQAAFGSKDLNPKQVQRNQELTSKLSHLYKQWGYEEVSPPNVERLETLIAGGAISDKEIVKIVADEPLGLRPEMTASIARAATTRLANKQRPLRLWATGTVFKSNEDCDGKYLVEEQLQSGVELIGISGVNAEVELLYLLLEALNILKIRDLDNPILLIGHKSLFNLILKDLNGKVTKNIENFLSNFDLINIENHITDSDVKQKLKEVLKIRGNPKNVLDSLESIYGRNNIFNELKRLFNIIEPIASTHGVKIQLDPTYLSHFDLYTGLIFELTCKYNYCPKIIARGGRYDELINIFSETNKEETGAGFSFSIDNIREMQEEISSIKDRQEKVLIAYNDNKLYQDALILQSQLHDKGVIAMVELNPCETKSLAKEISIKRSFDRVEWIS
ncbi:MULTISPECIES: ATP phosphoribosyltransferase regulatory subunit [unclassified Prochlorococcus]|uniref:ATP phosphoribosyltransferase regulatory subunit n=1 Tax=unclassified Prochlorococcus TaxID=2627481 RepID=UPI0005339226|nr:MULTISPECIES: ATP phosphoribosyltransferase regulatory subunit [unclassified Prochlorococcus]KGG15256.1 ATP phosphoribosyltransferase regulatory subunit [Prochlorococcus sp. MIT 0602]KGG17533.1 ATP phosphoribosyltransferase regulatory subunit [Prochlorococcus sp. MIT 0603]